jgi:hypothetical protein
MEQVIAFFADCLDPKPPTHAGNSSVSDFTIIEGEGVAYTMKSVRVMKAVCEVTGFVAEGEETETYMIHIQVENRQ